MSRTYFEKLKDSRWQEKRLRIMQRDGFACMCCELGHGDEVTLNVHHVFYMKCDPWEYPDHVLQTLCENCHKFVQNMQQSIFSDLSKLSPKNIDIFAARFRVAMDDHGPEWVYKTIMDALLRKPEPVIDESFEEKRARTMRQIEAIQAGEAV